MPTPGIGKTSGDAQTQHRDEDLQNGFRYVFENDFQILASTNAFIALVQYIMPMGGTRESINLPLVQNRWLRLGHSHRFKLVPQNRAVN
jgi:hypothetical protein